MRSGGSSASESIARAGGLNDGFLRHSGRGGRTRSACLSIVVVAIMIASALAVGSLISSKGTTDLGDDKKADIEVNGGTRKVNYEISRLGESYLKPTDYAKLGRSDHTQPGINQWFQTRSVSYNDAIIHNSWPYVVASIPYSQNLAMPIDYLRASWVTSTFYQLKVDAENIAGLATGAQKDPWIVPIFHTGTDPDADDGGWVNMSLYQSYLTEQESADIQAGTHYANTFYGVSATEYSQQWGTYYNDGYFSEIQGRWDFNRKAAHKFLGLPGVGDLRTEYNAVGSVTMASKWGQEWINDGDMGMPLDIFAGYDYSLLSGNGPVYIVLKLDVAGSTPDKLSLWFWSQTWGGEVLLMRYLEKVGIEKNLMPEREDWHINATLSPTSGDLHERMTATYHATAWADKQSYNNPTWVLEPQHIDFTADWGDGPYVSQFDPYYQKYYGLNWKPTRMNWNPGMSTYGQRVHYWQTPMNWNLAADESLTVKLPSSSQPGWGIEPYKSSNFSYPRYAALEMQSNGQTGEFVLGHGYPATLYSTTYYDSATKTITIPGGSTFARNVNSIVGYERLNESGSPLFYFDISPVSHYNLEIVEPGPYSPGQAYTLKVTPLDLGNAPVKCNQTVQLPGVAGVTYGASSYTFKWSDASWSTTVMFSSAGKDYTLTSQDAYFYLDIRDSITVQVGEPGENSPPTADLAAQFTVLRRAMTTFTVTASDPDNDMLKYTWNWGDGTTTVTYTNSATHAYLKKGTFTLTVTVDDQTGLPGHTASDSAVVKVVWPKVT